MGQAKLPIVFNVAPEIIAPDVTGQVVIPAIVVTGVNPLRQLTQTLSMQLQPAVHIADIPDIPDIPDVSGQVVMPAIVVTGVNPLRQLTQTLSMQLQPAVHIADIPDIPDVSGQVVMPAIVVTGVNPLRQLTQTLSMQLQPAVHIAEFRTLPTTLPMHCPPTGAKPEMQVMQVTEFKHVSQFTGHCEKTSPT